MTDMPRPREDHSCGLITHPDNGPEIVVAGGSSTGDTGDTVDTVDIYTVNTDSWRAGNSKKVYHVNRHLEKCL